ncbi:response regulator [Candidatus Woesearchaeota archaeon]|nr:response regulator [Candidatus Woesearchaeota archaeon]
MKRKIVVVDDEQHILNLVKMTLQDDFEVHGALSGEEALDVIRKHKPSLVLLDVMMPQMDGYDTMRVMKRDEAMKSIPIIFLTAKGEWSDKMKALSLGGSADYITKPFDPEDLLRRAKSVFG